MLRTLFLLFAATVLAHAAAAQNAQQTATEQKRCEDEFKAADINNDGVPGRSEIGNARQRVPSAVAKKDQVTRQEFMAAISTTREAEAG